MLRGGGMPALGVVILWRGLRCFDSFNVVFAKKHRGRSKKEILYLFDRGSILVQEEQNHRYRLFCVIDDEVTIRMFTFYGKQCGENEWIEYIVSSIHENCECDILQTMKGFDCKLIDATILSLRKPVSSPNNKKRKCR